MLLSMGSYKDYNLFGRTILREAWDKTKEWYKKQFALQILGSSSYALAGYLVNPFAQLGQLTRAILIVFSAVVLMFITIFIWNIFTAPFRIWRKQKTDLVELQAQKRNKEDKQIVLTAFHKIADLGNTLRVKLIKEDELEAWKQNVNKFRHAAIVLIGKYVSRTEAINFNVTEIVGTKNYGHKVNEEHDRELSKLGIQMDKLIAAIRKYEEKN